MEEMLQSAIASSKSFGFKEGDRFIVDGEEYVIERMDDMVQSVRCGLDHHRMVLYFAVSELQFVHRVGPQSDVDSQNGQSDVDMVEEQVNGGGDDVNGGIKGMDIDGGDDVLEPTAIPSQAMPNPDLGDVHVPMEEDVVNNLVDDYQPIQHKQPDEDDAKIEEHILGDLDINDEDSYLDIELNKEQEALDHLRVLLNSASSQDNKESFLSLSI